MPKKKNKKPRFTALDRRLAKTIGYGPRSDEQGAMGQAFRDFIKGKTNQDTKDHPETKELFEYSLGKTGPFEHIEESPYKPTKAKDPNAKYMRLKGLRDYFTSKSGHSSKDLDNFIEYNGNYPFRMALGQYHVSKGEDKEGKYVSIYDKWDFSNKAANKLLDRETEIYDRLYYKDNPTYKQDSAIWKTQHDKELALQQIKRDSIAKIEDQEFKKWNSMLKTIQDKGVYSDEEMSAVKEQELKFDNAARDRDWQDIELQNKSERQNPTKKYLLKEQLPGRAGFTPDKMSKGSAPTPELVDGGAIIAGAASGAAMGSVIGPWGTAAGAVIGGVSGFLKGREAEQQAEQDQNAINNQNMTMQRLNSIEPAQSYVPVAKYGGYIGMPQLANGGALMEYGGQTHDGPQGGIPVDSQGNPVNVSGKDPVAIVENKEVVWYDPQTKSPYVFSEKSGHAAKARKLINKYNINMKTRGVDKMLDESVDAQLTALKENQEMTKPKSRSKKLAPGGYVNMGNIAAGATQLGNDPINFMGFDITSSPILGGDTIPEASISTGASRNLFRKGIPEQNINTNLTTSGRRMPEVGDPIPSRYYPGASRQLFKKGLGDIPTPNMGFDWNGLTPPVSKRPQLAEPNFPQVYPNARGVDDNIYDAGLQEGVTIKAKRPTGTSTGRVSDPASLGRFSPERLTMKAQGLPPVGGTFGGQPLTLPTDGTAVGGVSPTGAPRGQGVDNLSPLAHGLSAVGNIASYISAKNNPPNELPFRRMAPETVSYAKERYAAREDANTANAMASRSARDVGANAGLAMSGMTSARTGVSRLLGQQIGQSFEKEANVNAQLAQQANMANLQGQTQADYYNTMIRNDYQSQLNAMNPASTIANTAASYFADNAAYRTMQEQRYVDSPNLYSTEDPDSNIFTRALGKKKYKYNWGINPK